MNNSAPAPEAPNRSYETLITDLIDPNFTPEQAWRIAVERVRQTNLQIDPFVNLALTARAHGWTIVGPALRYLLTQERANIQLIQSVALICLNNQPVEQQGANNAFSFILERCLLGEAPEPNFQVLTPAKKIEFLVHCLNEINSTKDDYDIENPRYLYLITNLPLLWREQFHQALPVRIRPGQLDDFTRAFIRYPTREHQRCRFDVEHTQAVVRGVQNYRTHLLALPQDRLNMELLLEIGHLYSFGVQLQILPPQGLNQFCPGYFTRLMQGILHAPREIDALFLYIQFCEAIEDNTPFDSATCLQMRVLGQFIGAIVDTIDDQGVPLKRLPHLVINFQFLTEGLTQEERAEVTRVVEGMVALAARDDRIQLGPILRLVQLQQQRHEKILVYLTHYFRVAGAHQEAQLDLFYDYLFEPGIMETVRNNARLHQQLSLHYRGVILNYWNTFPDQRTEEHTAKDAIFSQFFA